MNHTDKSHSELAHENKQLHRKHRHHSAFFILVAVVVISFALLYVYGYMLYIR
jgi:hypothetical protein